MCDHHPSLYSLLYSVASDKLGAVWDVEVGQRVKKLKGHSSFVNSCGSSPQGAQSVCTGSDDGTIRVSGRGLYRSACFRLNYSYFCFNCLHSYSLPPHVYFPILVLPCISRYPFLSSLPRFGTCVVVSHPTCSTTHTKSRASVSLKTAIR